MKKLFSIAFVAFLGLSMPALAQDSKIEKGAKKAWKGTKKGAKVVGNKTAELATKGKAKVTDKTSDEWVGPAGQTIYVDDGSKYYWVNKHGKRIFVEESALKPKMKKD